MLLLPPEEDIGIHQSFRNFLNIALVSNGRRQTEVQQLHQISLALWTIDQAPGKEGPQDQN